MSESCDIGIEEFLAMCQIGTNDLLRTCVLCNSSSGTVGHLFLHCVFWVLGEHCV